jgi:hypothetical protein
MKIDEAWQNIAAAQFQHSVTLLDFGPPAVIYGHSGIADIVDGRNAISLYHDIHRANGRCAFSIDHNHSAEDQAIEWAFSPIPVRRQLRSSKNWKTEHKHDQGYCFANYFLHKFSRTELNLVLQYMWEKDFLEEKNHG